MRCGSFAPRGLAAAAMHAWLWEASQCLAGKGWCTGVVTVVQGGGRCPPMGPGPCKHGCGRDCCVLVVVRGRDGRQRL